MTLKDTLKDRLNVLNSLRKLVGQKPLKSWKASTAKIEEQISKLKAKVKAKANMDNLDEPENEAPEDPKPIMKLAPPARIANPSPKKKVVTKKRSASRDDSDKGRSRQTGIGAIVKPLINEGLSNSEIFDKVMKSHPDLLCTEVDGKMKPTKKWYISWYRGDLRRKGKLNV